MDHVLGPSYYSIYGSGVTVTVEYLTQILSGVSGHLQLLK